MAAVAGRVLLDIAVRSHPRAVRHAVETLSIRLAAEGLPDAAISAVELVLAEAMNNIVEHAYPRGGRQAIRLRCLAGSDALELRLTDTGRPFPAGRIPLGLAPGLDVATCDLPEGGFGWFLIHSLTSGLRYSRAGGENRLDMTFDVALPAKADADRTPRPSRKSAAIVPQSRCNRIADREA
ncbi:ATP-binding protein [Sulfitobacter aestuarii]|uniref:ATP-binding protein n=1 Tax=Sulfitobacter aestuarii TaxID=2161676 RepID=A0ABW5U3G4_9RHOB